jgi:CDP-glucose 4,6-dehydratase
VAFRDSAVEGMDLSALFSGFYAGRRVLVTGHTGFKGSWLTMWLRTMGARVTGIALDPDTTPAHWNVIDHGNVVDHRVDVRDGRRIAKIIDDARPEIVFHLAAQPLVRRSYVDPAGTFDTNVMGLVNLLEAVRRSNSVLALVNATTDKVYEDTQAPDGYVETDRLGGHDPYSSSKACAELVSNCYARSFFKGDEGARLATARAGNVIGGGDWAADRLIPDLVRAASTGTLVGIRYPDSIRPWQHVLEPLSGYLRLAQLVANRKVPGGAWNFGPGKGGELAVSDIIQRIAAEWPAVALRAKFCDEHHLHEATVLRLSCDKASDALAWQPVWDIDRAVRRTVAWYRTFNDSGAVASAGDLQAYCEDACVAGHAWAT